MLVKLMVRAGFMGFAGNVVANFLQPAKINCEMTLDRKIARSRIPTIREIPII